LRSKGEADFLKDAHQDWITAEQELRAELVK
jgi:hypothetical protein